MHPHEPVQAISERSLPISRLSDTQGVAHSLATRGLTSASFQFLKASLTRAERAGEHNS